jgi:hypothetical protein
MKGDATMKGDVRKRSVCMALALATILALVVPVAAWAEEIPWEGPTDLPDYVGAPAKAHPSANSGVPQNPLLAPNPFNTAHLDPWNSDVADIAGALGRNPAILSSTLADAREQPVDYNETFLCELAFFDSHGHGITVCFAPARATVVMFDPDTLAVLSSQPLPPPPGPILVGTGKQKLLSSMGAIYSYLDARDRFTVVVQGKQIWTFVEGGTPTHPVLEIPDDNKLDLSEVLHPEELGNLVGVALDAQGRIWFTTAGLDATASRPAVAGRIWVLNPAKSAYPYTDVKYFPFGPGEQIRNTFALDKTGVDRSAAYVVTSKKLYRVEAGADDDPYEVWSEPYDTVPTDTNDEIYMNGVRYGQYELGSGTSPTILGEGKYVAITDNAPQLQVVVFRTDERLGPKEERIVCEVPVFDFPGGGAGALSNSVIGSRLSLIATNNTGYYFNWSLDPETKEMTPSLPGVERIDIDANGQGCHKVWTNQEVATTTCPRLSTRTGLLYTMARVIDQNGVDVYYWTALDYRTGEVVWQKMAGVGSNFDAFYPGVSLGPTGMLYYGGYGGLMMLRDTP